MTTLSASAPECDPAEDTNMSLPTPRELEKLARACRKAGITHFKCGEVEFTLGDAPVPATKNHKPDYSVQGDIDTNAPSGDDLLFWSTGLSSDAISDPGIGEL